jgi:hypothetical protein
MRRLPVIALLLFLASGCSEPPQKEIDQAQGAIDTARAAGADKYAVDEYSAATSALQKAHDAVSQRDYRQALSYALDARERAQESARVAADGRARAHTASETRIADISARIQQLEARLKGAEAARVPPRDLRPGRAMLTEARTALQKARTAFDTSDYQGAMAAIDGLREKLDAATREVAAEAQHPVKKKK